MRKKKSLQSIKTKIGHHPKEYPPHKFLIKAMSREFAEKLIDEGALRMWIIDFYRNIENKFQGDNSEGIGRNIVDGKHLSIGSANSQFIWCLSMSDEPESLKSSLLNLDNNYDTLIVIVEPIKFIKGFEKAVHDMHDFGHKLLYGPVRYDKNEKIDRKTFNKIYPNYEYFSVFQKDKILVISF